MNIKKLKNYDFHQAKVGDLVLCWSLNKGEVVYIDHNQVVVRWEDVLSIFDIEEEHRIYLRPLAWLGDAPVYKGDVIYSRHSPEFVADNISCGRLYSTSGPFLTMNGDNIRDLELFSLTPVVKTINVNGFEVPAPITCQPEKGADYYIPSLTEDAFYCRWIWQGDMMDRLALERGLAHTTKEAAVARTKAMLGIDPEWSRDKS